LRRSIARAGYQAFSAADLPTEVALETGRHDLAGRKTTKLERDTVIWSDYIQAEGVSVVCKMYRNRGGISWQREHCFGFRVEREHNALSFLAGHGVPCSIPRFWSFGQHRDHGRYEILCMDELPNVAPIPEEGPREMPEMGSTFPDWEQEIDIARLCGVIRKMHESGFYHGRLDLRNILVGDDPKGGFRYYVIDTPQAILFPYSIVGTRMGTADLSDFLSAANRRWGPDARKEVLLHYLLNAKMRARLLEDSAPRHRQRLTRSLRRFEFGLRSRLAYLFHAD
jgi:hypothetical protein